MIQLHVEPNTSAMSWEKFRATKPVFSIALDGYVYGGPKFQKRVVLPVSGPVREGEAPLPPMVIGPYANFNHHEEVDRLATRATCAQILMAIRQGFFDTFRNGYKDTIHVYVNDCDQDVCMAVFLLRHGAISGTVVNPILNRLVFMEDMLDTTAGAYPFPMDMEILQELAWTFKPYTDIRLSGGLSRRNANEFESVIELVEKRIEKTINGRGEREELQTDYDVIGGGSGWTMVEEKGAQARTAMFGKGIRAFVSVRERANGNYDYSIGRMSTFVPFDIPGILAVLNEAEGCGEDCWGGADTIGGSPRIAGSRLTPKEVENIINFYLTQTRH
ncbi:MAG: hypothetical protein NTX72_01295 [Candidatus Uhrbacteria bacterium]|nr:hypothetical protein [Candidatus Uhrbacteria bacterium]